jgi:hypothetical protein
MSQKKLLVISIIILILVGSLLAFYFYFVSKKNITGTSVGGAFPSARNTINQTTNSSSQGGIAGDPSVTGGQPIAIGRIHQITPESVAGSIIIQNGSTTLVRYVETATGHIYEARVEMGPPVQISNTTIPKILEAIWTPDGASVFLRYLGDTSNIKTFFAKLRASIGTSTNMSPYNLDGNFLPDGITNLSVSKAGAKIFYLGSGDGGALGNVSNPDGSRRVQLFASPFIHWQSEWSTNDSLFLTTNGASSVPGTSLLLPKAITANSVLPQKILSNVYGLTASLSPSGESVLYSTTNQGGGVSLHSLSLNLKNPVVDRLSIRTYPEKCVWSKKEKNTLYCAVPQSIPDGENPDTWYQGLSSFYDSFWKINIVTGEAHLIYSSRTTSEAYDGINLTLSSTEDYLLFTNKKDNSLWSLRVIP